jgi:DNA-binding transcriptional LysR family regulator
VRGSTHDSEWTDYKILLALKEGGSVAGAARVLGVDAATVSRRLAAAESALGAVLVVRGGRQFLFTAEGTTALEAARGMHSLAVSAASAIRAAKAEIEGLVRVSCVAGLASLLVAFQALVEEKHPGLHVDVSPDFHRADLANGEADIALRMSEPKEADLIGVQGFEIGLSAFASRSYVAACGLPATREDLRAHKIIRYTRRFADVPEFGWIDEYAGANAHTMRADGGRRTDPSS